MTILEDLKAGRLVVVSSASDIAMDKAGIAAIANAMGATGGLPGWAASDCYKAMLAASPDHTPALVALIEERDRLKVGLDEAVAAFANGAYDDACKRETGIHQHALAFTVEQFRKAEARALAAEAERDALREALAPFAEAGEMAAISGQPPGYHVDANAFTRAARALTEKNNV